MSTLDESSSLHTPDITPSKRKRSSWVALIASIAILIAIGCWFQLVHQQKKTTNNYSQLQSSFHQTLSDTAQLSQTISDFQSQINAQNSLVQALSAAVNRMEATDSGYELDLALQLTDRYIQQAYLNLTFNHDIAGTIILLQAADQRLSSLMDTQTIPLRRSIAASIVKLQAIPSIDNVGILSKLAALRDQAATIPLFAVNPRTLTLHPTNEENTLPAHPMSTWEKAWFKTLQTFKSLVIIRNRNTSITPLISRTQEEFLRQNLQLMFQQAQWAVLQHNQSVYQFSLNQASEWIQRYFVYNDQGTQNLMNTINELKKIDLTPLTPDLKPLIDQIHNIQMQTNKSRTIQNTKIVASKLTPAPPVPETNDEDTPNSLEKSTTTLAPPIKLPVKNPNPKGELL